MIATPLIGQGAILNYVESTFGLGTHVLGGDDLTNGSEDLSEMFNYSRIFPLPYSPLPSNFVPTNNGFCPLPSAAHSACAGFHWLTQSA